MDVSSTTPTICCSKETLPLFLEPFSFAIKRKHQKLREIIKKSLVWYWEFYWQKKLNPLLYQWQLRKENYGLKTIKMKVAWMNCLLFWVTRFEVFKIWLRAAREGAYNFSFLRPELLTLFLLFNIWCLSLARVDAS
ncbi:hypothetical protein NC651_007195 [Populus alba x Populus x berolinensis]|nr:hypothetical protein NC651_007195 [Populus alba x Populus x berolinensis]